MRDKKKKTKVNVNNSVNSVNKFDEIRKKIANNAIYNVNPPAVYGEVGSLIESYTQNNYVGDSCESEPAQTYRTVANLEAINFYNESSSFIGYHACAIVAQNGLINKACSLKGEDATRGGWVVSSDSLDDYQESDERFNLKLELSKASKFNKIFGVRHILFKCESNDKDYYLKPFNLDSVENGKYKGFTQIDPNFIVPDLTDFNMTDPTADDFYKVKFYNVYSKKIHASHFAVLKGAEVSDALAHRYNFGGLALTQMIYERAFNAETSANELTQLLKTKRMYVHAMDGLEETADAGGLQNAMNNIVELRDNFGFLVTKKEDVVTMMDTALNDADIVTMTQYQLVASIAGVPATKLLGTTPKGFNATGEHEIKTYHEELESEQARLSVILEEHYKRVAKSNNFSDNFKINWEPLDSPSSLEIAQINSAKVATDAQLASLGVIDSDEIRMRLIDDETSGYNSLEPFEPDDFDDLGGEYGETEE